MIGVQHTPVADGTSCADGDVCNGDETCLAGSCSPGTPLELEDGDPCTVDSCDPISGVAHEPAAAGTACADSNACDGDEVCNEAGQCVAGEPPSIDDGDPSTLDFCDPSEGIYHVPVPDNDPTVATDLFDASAFLYTGPEAVQLGVTPGYIDYQRVAVLRGRVEQADGSPLPGVTVEVVGEPDSGSTTTQGNGGFDMVVNGGGWLTVNYDLEGYLPVHRKVWVPWRDYTNVDDIVMVQLDPQVTEIQSSASDLQVAQGSTVVDNDGARQATVLFPAGTSAWMQLPDGTSEALPAMSVRATEYTVGDAGPKAMPAELPAGVGYTYAVELSVDEAMAAGASSVQFDAPLAVYVDNFIGFPVGESVPLGYYDRGTATWLPAESGRVIELIAVTAGLAELDVDGDGLADDAAALSDLGISDAERERLALLYGVGAQLWRVQVSHFSAWDCNWGFSPPQDACSPGDDGVEDPDSGDSSPDDPCEDDGKCVVELQSQVLRESLPVAGTDFEMHYSSARTAGYVAARELTIPLSTSELSADVNAIDLDISIAGRSLHQRYEDDPVNLRNQTAVFTWDGLDAYDRPLLGAHPVRVSIGYEYDGVYQKTDRFGYSGNGTPITGDREAMTVTLWKHWASTLGAWQPNQTGLGGWSLTPHHAYDPTARVLHRGDGKRRAGKVRATVNAFAGTGVSGFSGDGGPALEAQFKARSGMWPQGPDGSVYVVENNRIRRVTPAGDVETAFYSPSSPFESMNDTTVCPDGRVHVSTGTQIWRVRGRRRASPSWRATATQCYMPFTRRMRGRWSGARRVVPTSAGSHAARTAASTWGIFRRSARSVPTVSFRVSRALARRATHRMVPRALEAVARRDSGPRGGRRRPCRVHRLRWDRQRRPTTACVGSRKTGRSRRWPVMVRASGASCAETEGKQQMRSYTSAEAHLHDCRMGLCSSAGREGVRVVDTEGIITMLIPRRLPWMGLAETAAPPRAAQIGTGQDSTYLSITAGPDGRLFLGANYRVRAIGPALPGIAYNDIVIADDTGDELYVFNSWRSPPPNDRRDHRSGPLHVRLHVRRPARQPHGRRRQHHHHRARRAGSSHQARCPLRPGDRGGVRRRRHARPRHAPHRCRSINDVRRRADDDLRRSSRLRARLHLQPAGPARDRARRVGLAIHPRAHVDRKRARGYEHQRRGPCEALRHATDRAGHRADQHLRERHAGIAEH